MIIVLFGFVANSYSQDYNKETATVTDIDGNVYKAVKIGNQIWMAENLKVTHYRNGDIIPNIVDNKIWSDVSTGAYCYYNNDTAYVDTYGLLYNWYAVTDSANIAPEGWHVPNDEEWKELEMFLGISKDEVNKTTMDPEVLDKFLELSMISKKTAYEYLERGTDEGSKLKSTSGWETNENSTNSSGFSGLPGGTRTDEGEFIHLSIRAHFWTTTMNPNVPVIAINRFLDCNKEVIDIAAAFFNAGLSVRCVKD
ncbi:MAG: fibrobacter succinogenes major paralogous domain-containing protein [Ignavibacteria bacterium]